FIVKMPGEANVVAQTGADGVVLVDGGSAGASDGLMKAVSGLPGGGTVRTLFNTHSHPEQTGPNEQLLKAGVAVTADGQTGLGTVEDEAAGGTEAGAAARGHGAEVERLELERLLVYFVPDD